MSSIKKNLAYNMFYQILAIVLPLITAPYVSRVLGAKGVGVYSYTYSIANYFMLFTMLGISNHGNRSIAATRKTKKDLGKCFINNYLIQLLFGIFVTISYVVYVYLFGGSNRPYAWIQVFVVLSGVLDINWFFWGIEKFKLTVIRNTVCKVFSVICIFLFVRHREDLIIYIVINSLTIFVSQLLLWNFILHEIDFCLPNWNEIKKNVRPILILFLPVLAYSLYRIMAKIMIGIFSSMTEVGYYENAEKILNIPIGFITALGNVMLPRMSNLLSEGRRDLQKKYIRLSFIFVSIVEGALCFGISSVSLSFSVVYYGQEFGETGQILQFMIFTALISGWANVIRTQYLIPMKLDSVYVVSMLVAALVNFVLNLIFIPSFGAQGALIGTVSAELIVLIIQAVSIRKSFEWRKIIKENSPFILIGLFMLIVVRLENKILAYSDILNLMVQILTGSLIYISITIVVIFITKNLIYQNIIMLFDKYKNKIYSRYKTGL